MGGDATTCRRSGVRQRDGSGLSETPDSKQDAAGQRTPWLAWGTIAVSGALLRLLALLDQLPRHDEWHALARVSRDGFRGIASTFGVVDHSIPWTLYLELADRLVGIDEALFYLPGAIASAALALLLPWLTRRLFGEEVVWIWAALLAASPVLVAYARTARPYGVTSLLAPLAVIFWDRWRRSGSSLAAFGFVSSTATVGYALPPHLPFCLAVFLLPESLRALSSRSDRAPFLKLATATGSVLALLLLPPLLCDWGAVGFRVAGAQALSAKLLGLVPVELFRLWPVGVALAFWILAGIGLSVAPKVLQGAGATAVRRLSFAATLQVVAVLVVRPFGIDNQVVFGRYLLPVTPVLLLGCAIGLFAAGRRIVIANWARVTAALVLILVPLAASFTLALFRLPNGFGLFWVHGMVPPRVLFLDQDRQPKFVERWLGPFFRRLRDEPPGSVTLVEAPYSGIHFLPYRHYQLLHRQHVLGGLLPVDCGDGPEIGDGLTRHVVRRFRVLVDVLDAGAVRERGARWVVLHREPWVAERFKPPGGALPGFDFARCRDRLKQIYGEPSYEDGSVSVFDSTLSSPGRS